MDRCDQRNVSFYGFYTEEPSGRCGSRCQTGSDQGGGSMTVVTEPAPAAG